jgi:hypothetical protein
MPLKNFLAWFVLFVSVSLYQVNGGDSGLSTYVRHHLPAYVEERLDLLVPMLPQTEEKVTQEGTKGVERGHPSDIV